MPISLTGAQPGGAIEIKATAATATSNVSVSTGDFGKMYTNRGSTAVASFILPAPADNASQRVYFRNVANVAMIVKTTAAAQMVTYGDATASSITVPATAEGCGVDCICDGTSWICSPIGFVNSSTGGAQAGPTIA
jgi:hypothetical protein